MSDNRKIELTLDETGLTLVGLREEAKYLRLTGRGPCITAASLYDLIAHKINALPKPRMAEPTEFGAKVRAGCRGPHPYDRDVFLRVYPESAAWYSRTNGWVHWSDLIAPEPLP